MKKVIIIGATGSLAKVVIDELKENQDIELTLFARSKNRISHLSNTTIIEGDAQNYTDVAKAIENQDIVYVNLAGNLEAMTKTL